MLPAAFGTQTWFNTIGQCLIGDAALALLAGGLVLAIRVIMATGKSRATLFVLGFGSFMRESLVLYHSLLLFGNPDLSAGLAVGMSLHWRGWAARSPTRCTVPSSSPGRFRWRC